MNRSVQELASKKLDELVVDAAAQEAYFAVGDQMGLTPLGIMEDAESEA